VGETRTRGSRTEHRSQSGQCQSTLSTRRASPLELILLLQQSLRARHEAVCRRHRAERRPLTDVTRPAAVAAVVVCDLLVEADLPTALPQPLPCLRAKRLELRRQRVRIGGQLLDGRSGREGLAALGSSKQKKKRGK